MTAHVPSAPAKSYLSSQELIAEKSPQHFLAKDLCVTPSSPAPPPLTACGSVAVTSLVGCVVQPAFELPAGALPRRVDGAAEGEFTDLGVEFVIPFTSSAPLKAKALVRCYGSTLSSFARTYVSVGDVVHVLGHMAPMMAGDRGEYAVAVCALPIGGNLTIVVPSAEKRNNEGK
ncbi:hypothetical protein STCU_07291 [Strigomonas culicis]|nr:hypothetical protein STCU_07291 [Strigomonas culicis]|eukprot:EPY24216.1 hypothetical protein STCU_07291 [Strigomonas culicis]